eukprot:6194834-Pleurochrysis_carterae.AAC.2
MSASQEADPSPTHGLTCPYIHARARLAWRLRPHLAFRASSPPPPRARYAGHALVGWVLEHADPVMKANDPAAHR